MVTLNPVRLATLIGTVTVGVGVVKNLAGQPLPPQPADVTQLIICLKDSAMRRCQAYQIGTGRKIHIEMNGSFVQDVERNRITIEAAPGSTIKLTDNGPPTKLEAFGPARVDVEEFHFNETSEDTDVDLERSRSGTTTDLSYDHITTELKPIHGAKVSTYATHSSWGVSPAREVTTQANKSAYKSVARTGVTPLTKTTSRQRTAFSVSRRPRATSVSCSLNLTLTRSHSPTTSTPIRGSGDVHGLKS